MTDPRARAGTSLAARLGTVRRQAEIAPVQPPAYARLRDQLREEIRMGRYRPGQQLPTEQDLMAASGLSRHTVRMALDQLREDGIVSRQPGRGTFVTGGLDDSAHVRVISGDENIFGLALDTRIEVLEPFRAVENREMAQRLDAPGAQVATITFTRLHAGARIGIWHAWLPGFLLDEIGPAAGSLGGTTDSLIQVVERETGRVAARAEQLITAEAADEDLARHLRLQPGDPLLRVERTYFDEQSYPLEYVLVRYSPELFSYRLQLLRRLPARGRAASPIVRNQGDEDAR